MKTVLYGLNGATDICLREMGHDHEIVLVTTTGAPAYQGRDVLNLENLAQLNFDEIEQVIICSMFVNEITASLLSIGFPIQRVYFHDMQDWVVNRCADKINNVVHKDDVLYAFFDLACSVATFDVVFFAVAAEVERKLQKKKHIHFFIVPGASCNPDWVSIQTIHTPADTRWRIDHIITPIFNMIEATIGISSLAFREETLNALSSGTSIFPSHFSPDKHDHQVLVPEIKPYVEQGHSLICLKPQEEAKRLVDSFLSDKLGDRELVVVTLREYAQQGQRNSKYDVWADFIKALDQRAYMPVLVRDTYKSTTPLPPEFEDVVDFPMASIDLNVRVALYEKAFTNIGTATGPAVLPNFVADTSYVTFVPDFKDAPTSNYESCRRAEMIPYEEVFFRGNENQLVVWDAPTTELIMKSFKKICENKSTS
ncbi:hypothetical protein V5T82_07735 [Magnetovibrio sp. PR-2]|uniref:hypothetical protein n=1 Tax=Magnetovibrio sp. PR-2 TaxID=3120356 RepID=UPI002FCDFDCD